VGLAVAVSSLLGNNFPIGSLYIQLDRQEASQDRMVKGCADPTKKDDNIVGLMKKYLWWTPKAPVKERNEAASNEGKSVLEGKTTII
jgi:hypothetical protein